MRDAVHDLLFGSRCAVCRRPGRALCRPCRTALPASGVSAWPDPVPAGLIEPVAGGRYDLPLRPLLIDFKERGCLSHAGPLGEVLAAAVRELLRGSAADPGGSVILVPVPSTAAARRRRGFDPVLLLARAAASSMRRVGGAARVVPALRPRGRSVDQGGLDEAQRSANAHGRFALRPSAVRLLAGPVVVVDDIITTGNTLREAQQVLEVAGLRPLGAGVVAATSRRSSSGQGR